MMRTYTELMQLDSFDSRFEYLKLGGSVGRSTFGFDRSINQDFYTSAAWQEVRNFVMVRDNGCDLAVVGYDIRVKPLIHHMNPMSVDDIVHGEEWIIDPEYLITTTHMTHNAIHYGGAVSYPKVVAQRSPNDTRLW